ncbi:MAG: TonB-dependent receptor plug domain-containing protein [Bacteroidales bacterium]|nr:TonB-dependent receptor plug domain-containing protein [Bacteroidales bacterium]
MKKIYLLFLALIFFVSWLQAQDLPMGGKVTSATDKSAIPGVTIILKGTSKGTTTDLDGNYRLVVPVNGVLQFSYVGMKKQEVAINGKKVVNVELAEDKVDLGELVVVGYSTESKKLISGSFGVVNSDEIKQVPIRTIDGVLQGKVAGVTINQNSGTPKKQNVIKFRNGSSINASNSPLIIIDGVTTITGSYGQIGYSDQETDALTDLNPNDIEQFTFLKDASATAIYGARASNGVILITTKKGNAQKTSITLNQSVGVQTMPKERILDLMNAQEWNEYRGQMFRALTLTG